MLYAVYIKFNIVHCAKSLVYDIRYAPMSGDFDIPSSNPLCFSTQPGRGLEGMSWIGALLIRSCITIAFEYVIAY